MSTAASGEPRRRFYRRKWFLWPAGILTGLVLIVLLAFNLSPWPGALLIRYVFDQNAADVKAALEKHAPEGVASITDERYRPGDDDARLDAYFPEGTDTALPTVVWTHGGAWLSGSKQDQVPYFQLIAAEGYTVVALGYSLAPGSTYPTPLHQINDALAYLQANAERLHIDPENIIMAGSSAGAQLTSQMAAIITNPAYADALGITPSLGPGQLRGVVLCAGIYDMAAFLERGDMIRGGILGWGVGVTAWAYTGSRDQESDVLDEMSTIDHVTADFPPAFITGGNGDPLTDAQSKPLAERLDGLGVETVTLFYPADHEPKLGHEHQFVLDNAEGQEALDQILAFIADRVDP
jgi:acetyl esterase/lipase